MVLFTKVIWTKSTAETVLVGKEMLMDLSMKATGATTESTGLAVSFTLTETFIMVNGKTIRCTALVSTKLIEARDTKALGAKVKSMEGEKRFGLTKLAMKVNMKTTRKTVRADLFQVMATLIKAHLRTTLWKERGLCISLTGARIKANGSTTR